MIRAKHWVKVPSESVVAALPGLLWRKMPGQTPAAETAALMLYVALLFSADTAAFETAQVSETTYDDLQNATGLSRKLISAGLTRLIELKLIEALGSAQKRCYRILWHGKGEAWFKLPCQAIVHGQKILPFANFNLRSKYELHAMKLYLFLASCRRNERMESFASYERIKERIGIPEKDIRKAISLLITSGILRSVNRQSDDEKTHGPNLYYLTGCERLPGYSKDV